MSMRLLRCRCGAPLWFSRIIKWNDNGTISQIFQERSRVVIIESDVFSDVFSRIEKKMGISIGHLVFEAQRDAAREVIDTMIRRPPFNLFRKGVNKHLVVRYFCRLASAMGQAYAEVVRYRPGVFGEAIIRNPYNRELMAANVLGAFESLEGKPFAHSWKIMGGDDVIHIEPIEARPEISERLRVELPPSRANGHPIARCRICGFPKELGYLEWHENEGKIIDRRRGARMTFLDGYVPPVVFRELEKELGEDIYPLITRAQKEAILHHIRDLGLDEIEARTEAERTALYRQVLEPLPLWGQGYAREIKHEPGFLEVMVDNPYSNLLLAGHMAAVFEVVEGREAGVEWESLSPFTTRFQVRTA
ncbi:MAG: hypothetical protein ACUVSI_09125 [Actinomycetota bacterium]